MKHLGEVLHLARARSLNAPTEVWEPGRSGADPSSMPTLRVSSAAATWHDGVPRTTPCPPLPADNPSTTVPDDAGRDHSTSGTLRAGERERPGRVVVGTPRPIPARMAKTAQHARRRQRPDSSSIRIRLAFRWRGATVGPALACGSKSQSSRGAKERPDRGRLAEALRWLTRLLRGPAGRSAARQPPGSDDLPRTTLHARRESSPATWCSLPTRPAQPRAGDEFVSPSRSLPASG